MEADISIWQKTGHFYFALTRRETRRETAYVKPDNALVLTGLANFRLVIPKRQAWKFGPDRYPFARTMRNREDKLDFDQLAWTRAAPSSASRVLRFHDRG